MSLRPSLLDPLFAPVSSLPGVGPRIASALDRLLGEHGQTARILDLLFHLPSGAVSRGSLGSVRDAPIGEPVTLAVKVAAHRPSPYARARAPYRVLVEDETGDVTLVFFNLPRVRIEQMLPLGARRLVSGTIELWDGHRQMVHPARIMDERQAAEAPSSEPVYGLTEGVSSRLIGRYVGAALKRVPDLPEWQDTAWRERNGFPAFGEALAAAHRPSEQPQGDDSAPDPARRRLAYDELLATQLALALVRSPMRRSAGRVNAGDGSLVRRIVETLPFPLTGAQRRAVEEIRQDLVAETRMLRLLQGDVGSGKTLVALLAMASAVEAGRQAALVAPTEILARQHAERIAALADPTGLRVAVVTGRDRPAERRRSLAALAAGDIDIAVGTHALMQEEVAFRDLGLAVIDEQHRFGVHQRLTLGRKGEAVDVLVMTATPIPRTLALTSFGDMDISVLDEKPPGRQPIDTRLVSIERIEQVTDAIARALAAGDRVYWVCPLVAESEAVDLAAAEERHAELAEILGPDRVGLVHGRMKGPEKDAAMERFQRGDIQVLVSTTVIEVGVDVSAATVMVIEHAERFGLAQLHQLRGRIGRGDKASTCLLLYKGPLGETAKARLETMRRTENGFEIAEEDLRLRGEGELLGARQSGMAAFKMARLDIDADLLAAARDDARLIVERDCELTSERGRALRLLLYLFDRDAGIRLLRAG
ncbi:ATP-dependent DNA helicase RecG [Enterovirga aerilata]|uniref:ATP-dependent DNA helicase RecG n=1 Tax=Enterovirga aerilata TaxID=2730920 RepID=A0A849I6W3_9HYPH|nr:ATP-dependent DNA helicase RecG [Enterovirga sp. DB1703]NNM72055.1 ATP-dependent DNA helicase RecG [Enterovirga sp. DB1703]